jgi:putative ABC transport system permease protein
MTSLSVATQSSADDTTLVVYRENRFCPSTSRLPEHYLSTIQRIPGVKEVIPIQIAVNNCGASLDVITFRGVPPETLKQYNPGITVIEGSYDDFVNRTDGALVGQHLAERRGLSPGDKFEAVGVNVTVAGIITSDSPQDENVAYVHLPFLQQASRIGLGIVTQFNVKVDSSDQLQAVSAQIDETFKADQQPTNTRPEKAFFAETAKQMIELIGFTRWLGLGAVFAVLGLVANAVLLIVRGRVKETAILQTLGFSRFAIGVIVVIEGVLLGLIGGLAGVVGAMAFFKFKSFTLGNEGLTLGSDPIRLGHHQWPRRGYGTWPSRLALSRLEGDLPSPRGIAQRLTEHPEMLPFSYALRNLFRDPSRLAQTVGGSAVVVLLLIAAVALNQGMDAVLSASGSPQNVILVGKGSEESIERSEVGISAESAAATSIAGIESTLGVLAVSGEITYQAPITTASGVEEQALLRGVLETALLVHTSVRLLEGHFPGPGETMVGHLAHRKLGVDQDDLAVGKSLKFGDTDVKISGRFAAPGTVLESEIWFDRNDLASLTQRDTLSSITVRLATDRNGDIDDVELFAFQRNDLELSAIREDRYYEKLSVFYKPIKIMTWVTAALVAAGAVFGGLNTLYAAFAARIKEMATLQSIGYTRVALFVSLIQESLLATLTGTLLAFILAYFLLDGRTVPFSIGTFTLTLTPVVILSGLATGILLGTIGTLPPAIRCLLPSLQKLSPSFRSQPFSSPDARLTRPPQGYR